jgi:GTP-binding protein
LVRDDLRNVAIIAHVDHGKTSLVDVMLRQSGVFRENEAVVERVMDSNDLERERGITILSKNTAVNYNGVKLNIVDTPGHADFGGEVERVLKMVDGVLLIVDAFEGPMPQTKFVLRKALELDLKPIVVVNKIDRPDARPHEVIDEVFDLFLDLGANEDQLDFPIVYASGRNGYAKLEVEDVSDDLKPLFEMILKKIPAPSGGFDDPFQMLINNLDYDEYIGKIAIGRVFRGNVKNGENINIIRHDGTIQKGKISKLYQFQGLSRVESPEARLGDIIAVAGLSDINIGETIACSENPEQLPILTIDEPTLTMNFMVNNSPFAGQEGDHVTSRKLRERLFKELEINVSLKVEETDSPDVFKVSGRGELHLSILIENMRREGHELQVSKPNVIFKEIDGKKVEPIEYLVLDIPEDAMGLVMENLGTRKAEMQDMQNNGTGTMRLEFKIPARGLIGFRSEFTTATKGEGVMNHIFNGYEPFKGEIVGRQKGTLIAFEAGESNLYGLYGVQDRGTLFIDTGTKVYEGMIVGENSREHDMEVNICKKKQLTNMRTSSADEAMRLEPPRLLTLEQALEYINDDELVEITPTSIRLRKKILDKSTRTRASKSAKNA